MDPKLPNRGLALATLGTASASAAIPALPDLECVDSFLELSGVDH